MAPTQSCFNTPRHVFWSASVYQLSQYSNCHRSEALTPYTVGLMGDDCSALMFGEGSSLQVVNAI
jgi:hypothetical protein